MNVEPLVVVAGSVVMVASLILTMAFFTLNDRLETENKRLLRLLAQKEAQEQLAVKPVKKAAEKPVKKA
jgi:hypothetical protein